MTPARSLAASVIALGFASSLTAPLPAAGAPSPASCDRAEDYAAQSGAELLRIDRLDLRPDANPQRPVTKSSPSSRRESGQPTGSAGELLRPASDLTDGDFGHSGQGAAGFLSGTSDLLRSVTEGRVTAPAAPLDATDRSAGSAGSGGQGGGEPIGSTERHPGAPATSVAGVGLGEARTALVATAQITSAAVARMVDGQTTDQNSLTRPLAQQAPPTAQRGVSRATAAGTAGPLALGSGDLSARARWDAAMACGHEAGEAARSVASLDRVDLLRSGGGALIAVPGKISSRSATALERDGSQPVAVASATVTAGQLTLAAGRIKVRMIQPPALTVRMGAGAGGSGAPGGPGSSGSPGSSGGEVGYQPAVVEVSGPGIKTKRLAAAGDSVDVVLGDKERASESGSLPGLPSFDALSPGPPLALPSVPGLPSLAASDTESAPATGDGAKIRISLGAVRQASKAHAIAAKATAIEIAVRMSAGSAGRDHQEHGDTDAVSPDHDRDTGPARRGHPGYGGGSIVAEAGVGLLEAAAVAPEAVGAPVGSAVSGAGGGLPVTGPPAGFIALGGAGLVLVGGIALLASRRRRRRTG